MNTLLILCSTSLLGAALFNTLLRSLRYSGEAGLSRLPEKFPRFDATLRRWEKRWPEIISVVTLLAVSLQIATIWSAVNLYDIYAEQVGGPIWLGVAAVALYTLLNITLTRTLPGVLSEHYADRITVHTLPLCGLLYFIFWPLAFLITWIEKILHLRLGSKTDEGNRPSAGDEILTLVEQTHDHELDEEEKDFIRSALEFGETITREVMTPRVRMAGLEDNLNVEQSLAIIKDSPYSRFPLYHDDYDEILGMVHVKDLIKAIAAGELKRPLTEMMKPATFVPESMPISDLLRMMKSQKIHTAIAVDEYGGTAGVVTLEDILEELVGEIEDEHDKETKPYSRIGDGVFQVEANMPVDELNEELDLRIPEREEYDTIAGYMLFTLGRIPATGELVHAPGCDIRVQKATARRIQTLTLTPRSPVDEDTKT
jgi:CBS domain containing-hemolysin-like protein